MSALALLLGVALTGTAAAVGPAYSQAPDTVIVPSGKLQLRGLLWRPAESGPCPAVLFNHGSGRVPPGAPGSLGPTFARQGYVFLFLYRRGVGLSTGRGTSSDQELDRELAAHGQESFNAMQVRLLETSQLSDGLAGLAYLRGRPDVDPGRVAVAGHSYGGSLALLLAERDSSLRMVLDFGGAAASWRRSPLLRSRLQTAVHRTTVPIVLVYAANDYDTSPGRALAGELSRLGRAHRLLIYPPLGLSAREGHNFVYLGVPMWEGDVFNTLGSLTSSTQSRELDSRRRD